MLANSLSLLRILLTPLVVYSLYRDALSPVATSRLTLALMLAAGATDLLDGVAARRLGQISRLGKMLDPVADKVFVGGVCAALVWWRDFPLWLLAVQVARDLAIVTVGAALLRRRHLVLSASPAGKYATLAMGLTMLSFLFDVSGGVRQALAWITTGLLALSTLGYGRRLLRLGTVGEEMPPTADSRNGEAVDT